MKTANPLALFWSFIRSFFAPTRYEEWIGGVYLEYTLLHDVSINMAKEAVDENRREVGNGWALGRSARETARRISAP